MDIRITILAMACFLGVGNAWGNSAQPGFWNAGGTGSFSLLYPEDSTAYQKVQMMRELVAIQLYPGYAVVKGSYWMHNTTADSLGFRAGYPLFGWYSAENAEHDLLNIEFDSLYQMRVKLDGTAVSSYEVVESNGGSSRPDYWHTFPVSFSPHDTVLIEVYFILNTNNTIVRKGYDKERPNGFIYLLETGATWKQPIVQGEIRIQLMENLSMDDVIGIAPDSIMVLDTANGVLLYRFTNLSPKPKDNIVVAYAKQEKNFDFAKVVSDSDGLFGKVEVLSGKTLSASTVPVYFDDPFELRGFHWGWVVTLLFVLGVMSPILAVIIGLWLAYRLWVYYQRRRNESLRKLDQ